MARVRPVQGNYYACFVPENLAAKLVAPGVLEGRLSALVAYCLCASRRPIRRLHEARLAELYLEQRAGLLSAPDSHIIRVRIKPFRAWLLRNVDRLAMTERDLEDEFWDHQHHLMMDYAMHGPHFHNPDHRRAWEGIQAH